MNPFEPTRISVGELPLSDNTGGQLPVPATKSDTFNSVGGAGIAHSVLLVAPAPPAPSASNALPKAPSVCPLYEATMPARHIPLMCRAIDSIKEIESPTIVVLGSGVLKIPGYPNTSPQLSELQALRGGKRANFVVVDGSKDALDAALMSRSTYVDAISSSVTPTKAPPELADRLSRAIHDFYSVPVAGSETPSTLGKPPSRVLRRPNEDDPTKQPVHDLQLVHGMFEQAEYGERVADVVFSTNALSYALHPIFKNNEDDEGDFMPPIQLLCRVVRSLKSGGRLLMDTTTLESWPPKAIAQLESELKKTGLARRVIYEGSGPDERVEIVRE